MAEPPYDPRCTPARPDLAALELKGKVQATRFVAGEPLEVIDALAPLRHEPSPDAQLDTEALKGERLLAYEITEEGWAWGQLDADGYVGWLPANALARPGIAPTHKVIVPRTLVFSGPSIRTPPIEALTLGARIAIARRNGGLAVTTTGGYIPARHLASLDFIESDFVAVAERFLEVPYLWGGKSSFGIDCSGLVQIALTACGMACPRDSDMQERALGIPCNNGLSDLTRGDLIFWEGHVAIVRDPQTLIHANAFHMAVAIEPIQEAITRIRAAGSEVTSVQRMATG
jgi:cell wall-associated NlpC family hydrolase